MSAKIILRSSSEHFLLHDIGSVFGEFYRLIALGNDLDKYLNQRDPSLQFLSLLRRGPFAETFDRIYPGGPPFSDEIRLESVRQGSLELIIGGLSLASSIIVPFVIQRMDASEYRRNHRIYFEFSSEDRYLNDLIGKFQDGFFGRNPEDNDFIFRVLEAARYNVEILGKDRYRITRAISRSTQRIVRTITRR